MRKHILLEVWYRIEYEGDVIVARTDALKLAKDAGFSRKECNEISISVSELGTNILKYACPGMLAYRIIENQGTIFEVMAADWGKGIVDVGLAMKDFHTELGPVMGADGYVRPISEGLGCGLAAVGRLMTSLVIDSAPQKGTRIFATKVRKH